jgi:Cu/Ag efflux protein CusF
MDPPPAPVAVTEVKETDRSVEEVTTITMTARVEKIDQKTRQVTLLLPSGETVDVKVDEKVKNLPQVKRGDNVNVTYYESLALMLRKPGEAQPGVEVASDTLTAKPGERPAAAQADQVKITAKVTAIDMKAGTISLEGVNGKKVKVKARDKKRLEKVKVGDLIEAVYTEAVAIDVSKPAAK